MRSAIISGIPKEGKDPMEMGNYCALSILNHDYKVFTKILVKCLSKVIPSLIHIDQDGFVPDRLASSNMRRLLQVMSKARSLQRPVIALLLDTEKAFDRTEWPYLFHVLAKYGFGPVVLHWIRTLYTNILCENEWLNIKPHYTNLLYQARGSAICNPLH